MSDQPAIINPDIFREYDIRGIVDKDLSPAFVELLGKATVAYLKAKRFIVGYDNRLSSPSYAEALIKGLTAAGADVIDIGQVPTPVLYFALRKLNIPEGVMITGSHNPSEYNGFKIAKHTHCIYGKEIQELLGIMQTGGLTDAAEPGTSEKMDMVTPYVEEIAGKISITDPPKIILDPGNGAAGPVVEKLFGRMGIPFKGLFMEPDGRYPNHHPDPTQPKEYGVLIETLKKEGADIGIAYDGDGDRIGVIDENGEMRWGDEIMILYAREVLAKHPGAKVCIEVKCSQGLVEDVEAHGGTAIMCPTGHSLIEAKMIETGALLTGEMSGHIYFADDWYGFDDAIYSSVRLLAILASTGKGVSELLADAPKYYSSPEIRVEVPDDKKFAIVDSLKEFFSKEYEALTIDGVRFMTGDGWGLVRASNTQPALVVRAEGKTPEELEHIKSLLREQLEKAGVKAEF
ncbi:MAG: phosphomannomutase/phosphoglucomutase [archaeon]